MPVFDNPRRVIVETGGAGNELLVGLVAAVVIGAGAVWLVEQLAVAILITASALSAALTGYLVHRLRADGPMWRPARAAATLPGEELPARVTGRPERQRPVQARTAPRAIEAPKVPATMTAMALAIQIGRAHV